MRLAAYACRPTLLCCPRCFIPLNGHMLPRVLCCGRYVFTKGPKGLGYYLDTGDREEKMAAPSEKAESAAKHTYDVGYAKWDKVLEQVGDGEDDNSNDLD